MINDLIQKNRSYRRFHQNVSIDRRTLEDLVNLARLSASGANRQPLKYILSSEPEQNARIFPCFSWAGYLKDWDGPVEGERPSGYIIVLGDTKISTNFARDSGIACQSILLGAVEQGLGGCIIGGIDRKKLIPLLNISDQYEVLVVIALGEPGEKVVVEAVGSDGDIKYWRDSGGVHHLPKRSLDEIILD
ncbi:MAG: nitroreductase family protein [Desulfatiglandales bacterium]|jgi:nitroreductase|nr:nitroreductase family protein [Desulfatiglandales bacterium]